MASGRGSFPERKPTRVAEPSDSAIFASCDAVMFSFLIFLGFKETRTGHTSAVRTTLNLRCDALTTQILEVQIVTWAGDGTAASLADSPRPFAAVEEADQRKRGGTGLPGLSEILVAGARFLLYRNRRRWVRNHPHRSSK